MLFKFLMIQLFLRLTLLSSNAKMSSYFINFCLDVFDDFDDNDSLIYLAVQKTQQIYHGKDYYNGTNVVFVNGKMDPWHVLGKMDSNESVVAVVIEETAHCADMYPARADDPPGLVNARNTIEYNIQKWIAITTTTSTNTPNCPSQNSFEADQTITSPGFPFSYETNTNCMYYYNLRSDSNLHLRFVILELNIGSDDFIDFIDLRYGTVFASTKSGVVEGTELNDGFPVGINFRSGSVSEMFGRWRIEGSYVPYSFLNQQE